MMQGEDSDDDDNSDDNSVFSIRCFQARSNSYSRSNRMGMQGYVAAIQEREARCWHLDLESKSMVLVLVLAQLAWTFMAGSVSSLKCIYKRCTDDEDRILRKDKSLPSMTGSQRANRDNE